MDRNSSCGFPQSLQIANRRYAEKLFVLPAKVRGIVVTHPVASACCVETFTEQEPPGFLEAHLFLELKGTHRVAPQDRVE